MSLALQTARLELRPVTIELVNAILAGRPRHEIEQMVGAEMPWGWPARALIEQTFKASLDAVRSDPDARLWGDHLVITRETPARVVGSVIFHGKPDAEGTCQIAYGIEETSQNKGYGTEALAASVTWALEQPECRKIEATTTPWHKGSVRVLEKVGMKQVGKRTDPAAGDMLVYAITRS